MIATLGFASLSYFLLIDAFVGRAGGAFGRLLRTGLEAYVGPAGAVLVLALLALALTVWIGNLEVKRAIGALIVGASRLRAWVAGAAASSRASASVARAASKGAAQPLRPVSLREAFHLPARPSATSPARDGAATAAAPVAAGTSLATLAPVDAKTFITEETARAEDDLDDEEEDEDELDDATDDELDGDDLDDDDFDDEDDEDDEDDADQDEDEEGDERGDEGLDDDDDDEENGGIVVGEYEPAGIAADGTAKRTYSLPNLDLFDPPQAQIVDESQRSHLLEDTLASFGVGAKVTHVQRGPSITRYELRPERGVKISRISALADDIALALAATSVRIEAPIPGKSAVGIEVPNAQTSIVSIREILDALPQRGTVPPLHMALGKDITGRPVFGDLGKMPHLLVAGATGSGKSVCLNTIIASLLVSATPDQVQMLFIDPKRVELTVYNGIPHLIKDVITDARLAAGALFEMTKEMDGRYERFAKAGVRKIEEYNAKFPAETLPYVVIVIDELADLMLIAPAKVETTICRLAQLARATGIHLVVATQRPSVDVITGIIKANIPSRIAFAVSSQVDSRTIIDMAGAERLLGRGDMLFLPIDAPKPIRSQGALITGNEVTRLVEFWATQARPQNLLDVEVVPIEDDDRKRDVDPLCYEAARFIIESDFASTAQLQQRLSIGHPRAVRVMKQLEEFGIVGPHEGTKPRRINIGLGELETIADRLGKSEQTDLFAQGA
ncbi:MAG: DNA translocase FtsK [Candidatus Eremiobacteraeota bacterium]|nr:DNA translocase FtsK [Candidatus Eremiobacteraeota bacterium]MBC5804203.1 DNA translocase FtsK [Candidatus Eremiobacteraeota bacterium]MBC5822597.1 DNA translocase FtsK [Candidatus Eremiobacteraeota bacterium]